MASEQKCACGHPKESHGEFTLNGAYRCRCFDCPVSESGEEYHSFRLKLPWPDSEGWWWCQQTTERAMRIVGLAYYDSVLDKLLMPGLQEGGRSGMALMFGPMKFTKLLEKNPFA